jgi:hypothetical protein
MRFFSRAKRQESVVLLFILVFASSNLSLGKYSGGTGEPNDPYLIATPEDLNSVGQHPEDFNKCFLMTADINMAGYTYSTALIAPDINTDERDFQGIPFTGSFDGNDHIVFSLIINGGDNDYLGLFGKLEQGANIINLKIEDANITGDSYLGKLCGANYHGNINNVYAAGSVIGFDWSDFLGGLCGENYEGVISGCYATGLVRGHSSLGGLCGESYGGIISSSHAEGVVGGNWMPSLVGGLCGYNYKGTISNCYATGSVTGNEGYRMGGLCGQNEEGAINNSYANCYVSGDDVLGGLCGYNIGSINSCYATGNVSGSDYTLGIGGLCGINTATIINCFATGDITGHINLGGLCGNNSSLGIIKNSYATGSVIGTDWSESLGGLCGENYNSEIIDCYATGSVSGGNRSTYIGGLCGENYEGVISNCYATGSISGFSFLGGLCGENYGGTVSNSFWDIETSGISNSDGGIGLTTVEMQVRNTFNDAGWDMVNIWDIGENQTYPFLRKHLPSDINKDGETNFYDFAILAEHWLSQ